jgi:fido (protein-threonine AMPylation protein)
MSQKETAPMTPPITFIIRKIFDDYDEKNGAQQKIDYTERSNRIVEAWTRRMDSDGLTTELICELHRLVCDDVYIPINDAQGGILGFAKAGEYRTTHASAPSELHKGKRTLFLPPEQIPQRMEYLVNTMNGVFSVKLLNEVIIENIVAFTVEFLTVHPFANQNGRIVQVLMELLAFQAEAKPFHISYMVTNHYEEIIKSVEKVLICQSVKPFLDVWHVHYESAKIEYENNTSNPERNIK